MKISTTWSSSRMATRVSWSPEEMIISLFMDETPLVYGSGGRAGVRAREAATGEAPGELPHDRGDEHQDRRQNARVIHVSAARTNCRGPGPQLVNRRILTLRMRPKAASVAMIDEPP